MWYGKGPGVDRSGDVLRHANFAGTSKHGGVLALMGDDHTAESSTTAHQSEFNFVDVMIPILNPAGVQEIVDYGLYGWAMSRFTGTWVGLKCMHETVESTAVIDGSLDRVEHRHPGRLRACRPAASTSASTTRCSAWRRGCTTTSATPCWPSCAPTSSTAQITSGGRNPKIGIITVGKSYLDVRQALDELGIDEVRCNDLGLRLHKIACPWPIGREELQEFAHGLELIIVVEEKRSLIEVQVREELYGTANQPVCIGKKDEQGNWLFPVKGALDPNDVAICLGERLLKSRPTRTSPAASRAQGGAARAARDAGRRGAHPVFLLRLPAQFLDRGAGRQPRLCGHRLPLHGAVDGPLDARLHPDGRRGRELDRRGAVLEAPACLPEHRRRHLQPLRLPGDPRRDRVGRQHHLQDPVQRRGRDDRRPEERRRPRRCRRSPARSRPKAPSASSSSPTSRSKYAAGTDWPDGLTIHHRDDLDAVQRELAQSRAARC